MRDIRNKTPEEFCWWLLGYIESSKLKEMKGRHMNALLWELEKVLKKEEDQKVGTAWTLNK